MITATFFLIISCLLWATNITLAILSYWSPEMIDLTFALIPAVILEFIIMLYLGSKNGMGNSLIHDETPNLFIVLGVLTLIYVVLNGVINMIILRGGGPEIVDGTYCLWNHGFIREITEEEYNKLSLAESRFFTGHLLAFSAAPMLFFSTLRERKILQQYEVTSTKA